jgi:hypothetical protein
MYAYYEHSHFQRGGQKLLKCATYQNKQSHEPLKPTTTPEIPYDKVGCDLFDFEQKKYLMIEDYHSRYFDGIELKSATTSAVKVNALKATFSSLGIPMKLRPTRDLHLIQESSAYFVNITEYSTLHQVRTSKAPTAKQKEQYRQLRNFGENQMTSISAC